MQKARITECDVLAHPLDVPREQRVTVFGQPSNGDTPDEDALGAVLVGLRQIHDTPDLHDLVEEDVICGWRCRCGRASSQDDETESRCGGHKSVRLTRYGRRKPRSATPP